jgi:hypothetical protein
MDVSTSGAVTALAFAPLLAVVLHRRRVAAAASSALGFAPLASTLLVLLGATWLALRWIAA